MTVYPNTRIRGVIPLRLHAFLHLMYFYVNLLNLLFFTNDVHNMYITTVFIYWLQHVSGSIAHPKESFSEYDICFPYNRYT